MTTEMAKRTAAEAITDLRGYDHLFLTPKGVQKFADDFGITLKSYRMHANPNDPKGLTLNDGAKSAIGRDAASLAIEICDKLNVPYMEKFGRGSQLRECCDALEKHFKYIAETVHKAATKYADERSGTEPTISGLDTLTER